MVKRTDVGTYRPITVTKEMVDASTMAPGEAFVSVAEVMEELAKEDSSKWVLHWKANE